MKRIIIIISMLFGFAEAQQITYTPMTAAGYKYKYLLADSGFALPFRDTTIGRGTDRPGSIVCRPADSSVYLWNGLRWDFLGGVSTTFVTNYVDSSIAINNYYNGIDPCLPTILQGSIIWVSGFSFSNTKYVYRIGCQLDSAEAGDFSITESNDSIPFYVTVYADTLGNIGTKNGEYSGGAAQIPILDLLSQIPLATYLVPVNSTQPIDLNAVSVYKENTVPPEWAGITSVVGGSFIWPTNPYQGLYSTYIPSFVTGDYVYYYDGSDHDLNDYTFLYFYIRLGTAFTNSNCIVLYFRDDSGGIGYVYLPSGQYGLNGAITGSYQLVAIPKSAIVSLRPATTFQAIEFQFQGTGGAVQLDNVILQEGGGNESNSGVIKYNGQAGNVTSTTIINTDSTYEVHIVNGVRTDSTKILKTVGIGEFGIIITTTAARDTARFSIDSSLIATRARLVNELALKQNLVTLTTTGSSGAATFNQSTGALNIPQYSGGGGGSLDSLVKKGLYRDSVVAYEGLTGVANFIKEQYFNIKNYRPVGYIQGTTDATQMFKDAIAETIAAGGGTIYIPYDTMPYKISGALITSLDGVNPNCQIPIPNIPQSEKLVSIKFLGGTIPNFVELEPTEQGVVIESTIQGTGQFPSVFGSSYQTYFSEGIGYRNFVNISFENIIVRTSTKTAGVDVAGTMSGINMARANVLQTKNVSIDISSALADMVEPTNETYGIIFPSVNNNVQLESSEMLRIVGYKNAVVAEEHYKADYIVVAYCVNGLVVDSGYHAINIGTFLCEGVINNIAMVGRANVNIQSFHTEHYSTGWNTNMYDVKFTTPSSSIVSGSPYSYPSTLGFLASRSVHIEHFNQATPSIGTQVDFRTNDSTSVFVKAISEVDLVETIQYLTTSGTQNINLLYGNKAYLTLTSNTVINFTNSFLGKDVTLMAKQDANGGRTITIMGKPVGVDYTSNSVTKINAVNTANGWVIHTDVLDTTASVGFGTTVPQYDIHVKKSVSGSSVVMVSENTNSLGLASFGAISNPGYLVLQSYGSAFAGAANKNIINSLNELVVATTNNTPIYFNTNSPLGLTNQRMTILGSGQVGVGTTSPSTATNDLLDIAGNLVFHTTNTYDIGTSAGLKPRSIYAGTSFLAPNGTTSAPSYSFESAPTTGFMAYTNAGPVNETKVVANTAWGVFGVQNNDATGFSGIEYFDNSGTLKVFTGYENTGADFRFDNLGSGGISFKIASVNKLKINNAGTITMGGYGAGTLTTDAGGNVTATSDITLKTNINDYKSGIKELMGIRTITYSWNKKSGNETKGTYAGFSAQNVKANIPFSTGVMPDGTLTLQDRAIMATMTNAIQEQQVQIEDLKKANILQQNKMDEMEKQIKALLLKK